MEVSKVVINKDLIKKETRYHADNYHFGALEMWYFISLQWILRISHEFNPLLPSVAFGQHNFKS